jgi:hypothetical protein
LGLVSGGVQTQIVQQWSGAYTALCGGFVERLLWVEARRRIAGYVLGELERKNGWSLAEVAGDTGPGGMQWLLNFYCWDTDGLRDDVCQLYPVMRLVADG